MDELTLVARLRADLPAGVDLDRPGRRLDAEISAAAAGAARFAGPAAADRPAGSGAGARPAATAGSAAPLHARQLPGRRGYRRRLLVAAAAAAAVAAAVIVAATRPAGLSQQPASQPRPAAAPGPAASAAQLVAYASRAAAAGPAFAPQPHQWIYVKTELASSSGGVGGMLFGPPDERVRTTVWTRVDNQREARLEHGRLVFSRPNVIGGSLEGWPRVGFPVNYRYLDSLPASPARLQAIIAANVRGQGLGPGGGIGSFRAIQALMENVVLSPRLLAGLYGVLARLHGVHFDHSVTDIAGRHGQGFYTIQEGYIKDEIMINPTTYAYMGQQQIAIRAHTAHATDGTFRIRKGHVLGWDAVLKSGIVQHAGDVP
jgi:hypothetical protein